MKLRGAHIFRSACRKVGSADVMRDACCVNRGGGAGFSLRAFTLLEIMIAVVAFAIVLVAINGVFYSALRLRNKSAASLEKSLPLQQALMIIKRDLANIATPGGLLGGQLQSSATANVPAGSGGMNGQGVQISPDLHTLSGLLDDKSPWPNVQKVTYLLMDSTNITGGKDLIRSVTRNLLPVNVEDSPVQQLLLTGVTDVLFSFHDGSAWTDEWDSTQETTKLPRAIRVVIQLASDAGISSTPPPVELVVPLLVEVSTNQTQQATQ